MNLGLRHVALRVKNAQITKKFYMDFLGMQLEWEPDPDNVYLTTNAQDNLAIHTVPDLALDPAAESLDHLGFVMSDPKDVDELFERAHKKKLRILKEPQWHRDGAYSFYMQDPDGHVVQIIYHPPIAKKEAGEAGHQEH